VKIVKSVKVFSTQLAPVFLENLLLCQAT